VTKIPKVFSVEQKPIRLSSQRLDSEFNKTIKYEMYLDKMLYTIQFNTFYFNNVSSSHFLSLT